MSWLNTVGDKIKQLGEKHDEAKFWALKQTLSTMDIASILQALVEIGREKMIQMKGSEFEKGWESLSINAQNTLNDWKKYEEKEEK